MDFTYDGRTEELRGRLLDFMDSHVYPAEPLLAEGLAVNPGWHTPPVIEELKAAARDRGLWNLSLPDDRYGAGLTNAQYAPLAEITGRSPSLARRR
jgi:acyl-CoA dehydrogenase